mmetsp:Transcript_120245/g.190412  ORF Transcript_120245/g.190412 Transcript_120245/m.190412 type:complete len:1081 (-) Transcript_120245:203-3445(-)
MAHGKVNGRYGWHDAYWNHRPIGSGSKGKPAKAANHTHQDVCQASESGPDSVTFERGMGHARINAALHTCDYGLKKVDRFDVASRLRHGLAIIRKKLEEKHVEKYGSFQNCLSMGLRGDGAAEEDEGDLCMCISTTGCAPSIFHEAVDHFKSIERKIYAQFDDWLMLHGWPAVGLQPNSFSYGPYDLPGGNGRSTDPKEAAAWEKLVQVKKEVRSLKICMNGQGLTNESADRWCKWFRKHFDEVFGHRERELVEAKRVDFSSNLLGDVGIGKVLDTLTSRNISTTVLMMHHNKLEEGAAVANYLTFCGGALQELHLSHNFLDSAAAADIVTAAAKLRSTYGPVNRPAYAYPRYHETSGAMVPLWLRMEQNFIDHAQLQDIMRPTIKRLKGRGEVLCSASGSRCTPQKCGKGFDQPPAVHAKNLQGNQRSGTPPVRASVPPSTAPNEDGKQKTSPIKEDDTDVVALLAAAGAPTTRWRVKTAPQDTEQQKESEEEVMVTPRGKKSQATEDMANLSITGSVIDMIDGIYMKSDESYNGHRTWTKSDSSLAIYSNSSGRWALGSSDDASESSSYLVTDVHDDRLPTELSWYEVKNGKLIRQDTVSCRFHFEHREEPVPKSPSVQLSLADVVSDVPIEAAADTSDVVMPEIANVVDAIRTGEKYFRPWLQQSMRSPEDAEQIKTVLKEIETVIREGLEHSEKWKVAAFGSVVAGFGTKNCDLDAVVYEEEKIQNGSVKGEMEVKTILMRLAKLLGDCGFVVKEQIMCARVPVLKLQYQDLEVDLSFNNTNPLRNTRLLRAYAALHPLVAELVVAIKLWAKHKKICGAVDGHLSSYAFAMMVIFYLQVAGGIEMPCLQSLGGDTSNDFANDEAVDELVKDVRGKGWKLEASMFMLFCGFFAFYAGTPGPGRQYFDVPFNWSEEVVSVRLGKREFFQNEEFRDLRGRNDMALHIEDPFERSRNLRDVMSRETERILHEQICWMDSECRRISMALSPMLEPTSCPLPFSPELLPFGMPWFPQPGWPPMPMMPPGAMEMLPDGELLENEKHSRPPGKLFAPKPAHSRKGKGKGPKGDKWHSKGDKWIS